MAEHSLERGVELFNAGDFFAAHEELEDAWRATEDAPRKRFLKAVVQVAVAMHHLSTGNYEGAGSVLERARQGIAAAPQEVLVIQREPLMDCLQQWAKWLEEGHAGAPPAKPRIELCR